jgi:AraC-like DNA-binding protein
MDTHPSVNTKLEAIYQAIHQYPERKYYIVDLAKQAGLTPQVFNMVFKQHSGITVPQCITKAKMERAIKMLLADHSIKEVAASLGYKQVINFHKTFKRFTGLTPRQYYLRNKSV